MAVLIKHISFGVAGESTALRFCNSSSSNEKGETSIAPQSSDCDSADI